MMFDVLSLVVGLILGLLSALFLFRSGFPGFSSKEHADVSGTPPETRKLKRETLPIDPDYKPEHAWTAQIEKAINALQKEVAEPESQWELFDQRNGVRMLQKKVPGAAVPLIRAESTIVGPANGLMGIILDPANTKILEDKMIRETILEELDPQTNIALCDFKGVGPVKGREFVVLRHRRAISNGVIICNTSVEHPGAAAISKGLVRANTPFNGWVFRQMDDGKTCHVSYCGQIDLCGSIPGMIIAKVAKEDPEKMIKLKTLADMTTFDGDDDDDLQEGLMERARDASKQLLADGDARDWEHVMSKHDIAISRKRDNMHKFRGEGIIPLPPDVVADAIKDFELTMQWDDMMKEISLVSKLDENCHVVQMRLEAKTCFLKQSRDFCAILHWLKTNDDTFVMSGTSVQHPKCAPRNDVVRAELQCGGWIVRPHNGNGGSHSKVIYVAQVDLRGGVPTKILDQIAMRVPLAIHYLSSWLKKKPKERLGKCSADVNVFPAESVAAR